MMKNMKKPFKGFAYALAIASCFGSTHVMAKETPDTAAVHKQFAADSNFINGIDRNQSTNVKESTDSAMRKTGEQTIDGKTVYFDQFGNVATGKLETKEGTYFFNEDGEKMTGFIEENGKTYYYDEETGIKAAESQMIEKDGKTYILNDSGATQQGWVNFDGQEYYLDEDGSIVKNASRDIDGGRYLFNEQGQKVTSTTVDGYIYDENGKGVQDLSGYDKIAQAALAQLGVAQDCTMLVTNSLKAVGINFHGAPAAYLSLGPMTDNPVPGDIIVYQGHVAIYIGDGKAVHGGWNGGTTAIFSVECSQPLVGFVHPILP